MTRVEKYKRRGYLTRYQVLDRCLGSRNRRKPSGLSARLRQPDIVIDSIGLFSPDTVETILLEFSEAKRFNSLARQFITGQFSRRS